MSRNLQLHQRLSRVFLLQLGFIALAAACGVFAAKMLLENSLIQQALRDEAAHFRERRAANPQAELPDTKNLKGYLRPPEDSVRLPALVNDLSPGFHKLQSAAGFTAAYVDDSVVPELILVFDGQRVEELAVYFGMLPLAGLLTLIYLLTWFTYRLSAKAVSPLIRLAREVADLDFETPEQQLPQLRRLAQTADREVHALAQALSRLTERVRSFVDRERAFTRDVSHELRSPITVVRMAADLLQQCRDLQPEARSHVERIKRAAKDMEDLTEAFLLLARESELGLAGEELCVNDIAADQIECARPLIAGKAVELSLTASGRLLLTAPEKVVAVLIGNLIRNACNYTERGEVRIVIEPERIRVEDSGIGIDSDQVQRVFQPFFRASPRGAGHGVGLTIVRRLSDRFGWPLTIHSEPGAGTQVGVAFPGAKWVAPVGDSV